MKTKSHFKNTLLLNKRHKIKLTCVVCALILITGKSMARKLISVFFAAAIFTLAMPVAVAAEKPLSAGEIKSLLSGNTAHGVHYGKRTMQHFSADGKTEWKGEGDEKSSVGEWKTESGKYCSRFPDYGGEWGCYDILHDNAQGVYYFYGDDFRAPFIVKDGYSMF